MADILNKIPVNDEMTIFKTEIEPIKLNACIDNILLRVDRLETKFADVQPVDRWISVEDRLPEVDKQVLVYIKKPDDNHDNVEKAHLSDKSDDEYPYWVFENGRFYSTRFRYATHWQPVPKPPKDGDNNA